MLNIFGNREDNRIIKSITKKVSKETVKSMNFGKAPLSSFEFTIDNYRIVIYREKSWIIIGNIPILPPSDVWIDYKIYIKDSTMSGASCKYEIKCSHLNAKRLYTKINKIYNLLTVDRSLIDFKKNLLYHFTKSEIRDDKLKKLL